MARVKNSVQTRARRKKALKDAKGYFGSKHRLQKSAKEQLMNSRNYAFRDRKARKQDFRKLWIQRINAQCREEGISYSKFISGLKKSNIMLDRKILSELAINDKEAFKKLVDIAKNPQEVKKEVKESPKEEVKGKTDYSKMTVKELKDLAQGIEGASKMKKQELIAALMKGEK